ncbi:MAG: bifunctional serine/threonine-protein kinase/formylglycine-generating enzyme family protein [Gemmataceae bacterium]
METSGCPSQQDLKRFHTGELADEAVDQVAQHIEECAECEAKLRSFDEHADALLVAIRSARDRPSSRSASGGETERMGRPASAMAENDKTLAPAATHGVNLNFLAPPEQPDELGRFGAFRVLKVLGVGGMGAVLQAEEPALQRLVAIKVMKLEFAADEECRQRFLREARAAAAVEDTCIVPIHQVGEVNGLPYLAMPVLKGESLSTRLKRDKKLPVAEAVRIARQIADGLTAAHEHGLIHRDIKPGNIWLDEKTGTIKLLDFGLARAVGDDSQLTRPGTLMGTPAYMAPEQAANQPLDHRCDLFSLGVVLYLMLTGERPFAGTDTMSQLLALAKDPPRPIQPLNADVSPALDALTMQLLAKEAARRPGSARAVSAALARFENEEANGVPVWPASQRSRRLVLASVAGLGGLLVLLLVVFGPFTSERNGEQQPGTNPDTAPDLPQTFTNDIGMEFVLVPRGIFLMGGGGGKPGVRRIEVPYSFYLGKYEVTQEQWQEVMGNNPSHYSRNGDCSQLILDVADQDLKKFPVENVSWLDIQVFLERLNALHKKPGWVYRLPSGEEWEYACRGGPSDDPADYGFHYYFDLPSNVLQLDRAKVRDNEPRRTCPVGSFPPNRLGLHDMHGNMWEWCNDETVVDGTAIARMLRGGSFVSDHECCQAANFLFKNQQLRDYYGFRAALLPREAVGGKQSQ